MLLMKFMIKQSLKEERDMELCFLMLQCMLDHVVVVVVFLVAQAGITRVLIWKQKGKRL